MNVTTIYKSEQSDVELDDGATVKDVVQQLELQPNTVLVTRNGEVLLEDDSLEDGDRLEILPTISGG